MTYEQLTYSNILTGRTLHFPKGTPIYQIHDEDIPIGGNPSNSSYFKTGKTLNEEFEVPETPMHIDNVVPYKNQGFLMHKDSTEEQKNRRKKTIIVFSLIAAAIICIIIYKRKHK